MSQSELERLIPPEIKNDELYHAIQILAQQPDLKTFLEIGSSSGGGSTEAFVKGLRNNPNNPLLFCMEISQLRFQELQKTYEQEAFVKCYNISSVAVEQFSSENQIRDFYHRYKTGLNQYPLDTVLGWFYRDKEYVRNSAYAGSGIRKIKEENGIDYFDVVLIDGCQFTGLAEFDEIYGAKFIILDDINTFKNYFNHQQLLKDSNYTLIAHNLNLRHGYSIFKKTSKKTDFLEFINKVVFPKEVKENHLLQKLIRPGMTVFDIGANVGDYTFLLSHLVGYFGKVYTFERTQTIFAKILAKIEEYDLNNILPFQKAVYSENTSLEFHQISDDYSDWNSLGNPVMKNPQGNLLPTPPIAKSETVEAISLDSFCAEHQIESIDFLKVAVEGAESYVFQGAANLLKNQKIRYIQFEISRNMLEGLNKEAREIFDILRANGYECHTITPQGEIGELATDSQAYYDNYIAFPAFPIHFFTIVLNGEPFIRYHIEAFKKLPFPWHWHIAEGVAELKHDTAYHLRKGGKVIDQMHHQGRSIDGTTAYLDQLAAEYPDNITIYRKPEGVFWDGKLEMVNAPLVNIQEECLLWQIDVDEFWKTAQITTARNIFLNNPDKTAAYYWCWYFVGENLVISSRNCYTQNPQQEWLRTWRFSPGLKWISHAPPVLAKSLGNGQNINVAKINPFSHSETERKDLVFQHFAYVKPEQLEFKENYYGYKNALKEWQNLQQERKFPTLLRQYLSWVKDDTMVDPATNCGIVPILQKQKDTNQWHFLPEESLVTTSANLKGVSPKIIIDGVFFQLYQTGIARVWRSLLEEWSNQDFAKHILLLDRGGTAPAVAGIRYRLIPAYNYNNTDSDRALLQQICDEEQAQIFISTYYTTPLSTPSVFMAYDMIPEVLGVDLNQPMWREKHYGIKHASAYIAISENTARDLANYFEGIDFESVTVAHCGVASLFCPASEQEIHNFKYKYGINKPYFLVIGIGGYKNPLLFFRAFAQLVTKQGFEIVCIGPGAEFPEEFRELTVGTVVHRLKLSDEELRLAYAGAVAFIYPSIYEGFGLPVLEAMACGTPVITCPNSSLPEVGSDAVIYVQPEDVAGLAEALCEVQKPLVRQRLIQAGLAQAQKFSWATMAKKVSQALIAATLLPLNLRQVNLIVFPDWSQDEETLAAALATVIASLISREQVQNTTLLIDTQGIEFEDANLMLSGILMSMFIEQESEQEEILEISLIPELAPIQWQYLLATITAKVPLDCENSAAIAQIGADNLPNFSD